MEMDIGNSEFAELKPGFLNYQSLWEEANQQDYKPEHQPKAWICITPVEIGQTKEPDQSSKKISRRKFIVGGLVALGSLFLSGDRPKSIPTKQQPTSDFDTRLVDIPRTEEVSKEHLKFAKDHLNNILAAPFNSQQRKQLEKEYVEASRLIEQSKIFALDRSAMLEQIDLGLMVIANKELRKELIRTRYSLRERGTEGLRQLTQEELDWAKEHKIHPEILGIATDQYFELKKMLQDYMDKVGREKFMAEFRPDLIGMIKNGRLTQAQLNKITVDDMLMNPGGMASLITFETGVWDDDEGISYGFCNIGDQPAINQLDDRGRKDLAELMRKISDDSGLEFNSGNILGSIAGAIGIQFMPWKALDLRRFTKEHFGFNFNPLVFQKAVMGAYIMYAQGEMVIDAQGKPGFRFGYLKGEDYAIYREWAARKWNNLKEEVDYILNGAISFYNKIISPNPDKFNIDFLQQYLDTFSGVFRSTQQPLQ